MHGSGESSLGNKGLAPGHLSRILQALQRSEGVSYTLDSQYRILYCNPAWDRFAFANGAPQLIREAVVGSNLFAAIPEVLRDAYSHAFEHVLKTGLVWTHSYECSSPSVYRMLRMRIHLLKPQNWFVVTNTLVVERPHAQSTAANTNKYVNTNSVITVCAHCRCSKRVASTDQWDFVPEYLQLMPNSPVKVSHGLCPVCRAYFYRLE